MLPPVRARPGGYRSLPDGTNSVYLSSIPPLDFWLVDLTTKIYWDIRNPMQVGESGTVPPRPLRTCHSSLLVSGKAHRVGAAEGWPGGSQAELRGRQTSPWR